MHKKVCKSLPAHAIPAVRRLPKTQLYPHADHSITIHPLHCSCYMILSILHAIHGSATVFDLSKILHMVSLIRISYCC